MMKRTLRRLGSYLEALTRYTHARAAEVEDAMARREERVAQCRAIHEAKERHEARKLELMMGLVPAAVQLFQSIYQSSSSSSSRDDNKPPPGPSAGAKVPVNVPMVSLREDELEGWAFGYRTWPDRIPTLLFVTPNKEVSP